MRPSFRIHLAVHLGTGRTVLPISRLLRPQVSQNEVCLAVEDLAPGMQYTFQVRASNQQGHSEWSEPSAAVTTKTSKAERPDPPRCAATGIDWIDLDALRPFDNGSHVVGFKVQLREISLAAKASWGHDLTLPIIEVEDSDSDSGSGSGSSVSGSSSSDEEDAASIVSTASALVESTKKLPRCRLHIPGLWADKTYDFRIAAINGHGASAWSLASQRARTQPPLVPAAGKALVGAEGYPNALLFEWEAPHHFGSPITGYRVEQQRVAVKPKEGDEDDEDDDDDDEEQWQVALGDLSADLGGDDAAVGKKDKDKDKDLHAILSTVEEGATTLRVEGLVTGSTYRFRCAAVNGVGQGPWGAWTCDVALSEDMCGDPFVTED